MQLGHAHGHLMADQGVVINHTAGKNVITRKEWEKNEPIPVSQIASVLVTSRDRLEFGLTATDFFGKARVQVGGIVSKEALDAFLRELAAANPGVGIWLAHPSHGLPDPAYQNAAWAAAQAARFNDEERRRREAAAARKPQAVAKTYRDEKDYRKDAPKMAKDGWLPLGSATTGGAATASGSASRRSLFGSSSAASSASVIKMNKITVTWMRQPEPYTPRDFVFVPPIPEPRVFPPEPYFAARLVNPVRPGEEFPAVAATLTSGARPAPVAYPTAPAAIGPGPAAQQPSDAFKAPPSAGPQSVPDKLRQLATLRDEGVITSEEFESAKARLLASL